MKLRKGQYVFILIRSTRGGHEQEHARVTSGRPSMRLKDGVGTRAGRIREPHYHLKFWHGGSAWVPAAEIHPVEARDISFAKNYWHSS
jgi:hypothetical protein